MTQRSFSRRCSAHFFEEVDGQSKHRGQRQSPKPGMRVTPYFIQITPFLSHPTPPNFRTQAPPHAILESEVIFPCPDTVSPEQLAATRANSAKIPGPRTKNGKTHSAQNARQYRRAIEEFERLKALREELRNEPNFPEPRTN